VDKLTPGVAWSTPAAIDYGTALSGSQLDASISPAEAAADGTLSYTADDAPASSGQILHAGAHTLGVAYQPGSSNAGKYTAATGSVTLVVNQAGQQITFGQPAPVTYGDAPVALDATATSSLPVALVSTTPTVCTVSGASAVIVNAGTCTIDADQGGNGDYLAAATVTRSFTVAKAPQAINLPAIGPHSLGDPAFTEPATGGGSGNPVVLASATPQVCTVSGGTVTVTGVGTCTLTADQAGNDDYLPASEVSTSFTVAYRIALDFDNTKAKQAGSVVPVKVSLLNSAGKVIDSPAVTLQAVRVDGAGSPSMPGSSQPGRFFTSGAGVYQFNWDTSGLSAGIHTLWFAVSGDPTLHAVSVPIKG